MDAEEPGPASLSYGSAPKRWSPFKTAFLGAGLVGAIGFAGGFFGPLIFTPEANQGPLLGICFTGPLGVVVGFVGGMIVGWIRNRNRT